MAITTPSTLANIASVLGISTTNAGDLFNPNYYNGNSFYKPCNSSKNFGSGPVGSLSDSERRAVNWGWCNLGGVLGQSTIYQAIVAKWDGGTWDKDYPKGTIGVSPYRVADYIGYDHNADTPFKMALNKSSITSREALRFSMENLSELSNIHNWGYMNSGSLNEVGLAVYVGSSKPSSNGFYVYMIAGKNAIQELQTVIADAEKMLNVPSTYLNFIGATSGTYYCIPFLIASTSGLSTVGTNGQIYLTDSTTRKCLIFPTAKMQFTVTEATTPIQKTYVELYDNSSVSGDISNYRVTVPSLTLKITNENSSSQSVKISTKPTAAYMRGSIISGSFTDKTVTVAANSTTTVNVVGSTVVWETYNLTAFVDVTMTVGGSSKTESIQIFSNKD